MRPPTDWRRKARLVALQLGSHEGFLIRRAAREALGVTALAIAARVPLPAAWKQASLQWTERLLPGYPEAPIALGQYLLARDDPHSAMEALHRAVELVQERPEQPVLPTIMGKRSKYLGITGISRENFDRATQLAATAARAIQATAAEQTYLDLRASTLGDGDAAIRSLHLSLAQGSGERCAERAVEVHARWPERAGALAVAIHALLETGQAVQARDLARLHRSLHPGSSDVWSAAACASAAAGDADDAARCLWRAAVLAEQPWQWGPALWSGTLPPVAHYAAELMPTLVLSAPTVALGERTALRVSVSTAAARGAALRAYVLPPYGWGVWSDIPWVALDGTSDRSVELTGCRPSRVNAGRPWSVTVVVTDGLRSAQATAELDVVDPRPGRVFHVLTDDHELHDTRASTDASHVQRQLVDKAKLALEIAEQEGASWGFMVEAAEVKLLEWAAARDPDGAWPSVSLGYQGLLTDAVARGHDLSLHVHTFYDPAASHFCQSFDPDSTRLVAQRDFLFAAMNERKFWNRAHPHVGSWSDINSKRGSLLRGLETIEALGRLGDPSFRVSLFRAGNYDFGVHADDVRASVFALRDAGIFADSDIVKGRIYTGYDHSRAYWTCSDDIGKPAMDLRDGGLVELPSEYNAEGDFLADAAAMNAYVDARLDGIMGPNGRYAPGVHILTAITHTKAINYRRGLDNLSLDASYGDWATLQAHLAHLRRRGLQTVRLREAIDAVVDDLTPDPIAVLAEEQLVAASMNAAHCTIRLSLRLLGAGIPVASGQAFPVRMRPPAWAARHVLLWEVENGGQLLRREGPGFDAAEVWVDADTPLEMRLELPIDFGVTWEPGPAQGTIRLRAKQPFRRAHVWLDGVLMRDVAFHTEDSGGAQSVVWVPRLQSSTAQSTQRHDAESTLPLATPIGASAEDAG